MASPLSDLDELVLKCRDQKAKNYIKEAVACYKAGAFRSAIVSSWIAVSFDIIDKLKDLTLAGDKEAEIQLGEFENARSAGDIAKSLKFERDLLEIARDKLELISHVEFIDLKRVQEDRNRCAHPSMTSDGEVFNPSAELARVHIRSAVEHLLQYPPAQGKYALDILIKEIQSDYFPTFHTQATTALSKSPLVKARESLVRNFIIVLLKKSMKHQSDYRARQKYIVALGVTEQMHRKVYAATLKEKLSDLFRALEDKNLFMTFGILNKITESWHFLDPDVQHKIKAYTRNLPSDKIYFLNSLLEHPGLSASAALCLKHASMEDLEGGLFFDLPPQVGDRMIELYEQSESYADANNHGAVIALYTSEFSKDQVKRVIEACGKNSQIKDSFEIGAVINKMRMNERVTDDEFNNWLIEADLDVYAK